MTVSNGAPHTIRVRVYYGDTDCGNVVYYANYLRYAEAARTEYMRDRGIDLALVQREHGVVFAVTDTRVKYRAPARYNDLLSVETELTSVTSILLTFRNAIRSERGVRLVEAETRLACIGPDGRATRIPAPLLKLLQPDDRQSSGI